MPWRVLFVGGFYRGSASKNPHPPPPPIVYNYNFRSLHYTPGKNEGQATRSCPVLRFVGRPTLRYRHRSPT